MKNEKEELDQSLKTLAKSSVIVFIGVFLSKLLTYVYRIVIARSFGPEVYGLFALAFMVVGIFVAFASLGLNEGILRYVALNKKGKNLKKSKYLLRRSLIVSVFSGVVAAVLLFLLSDFIAINIFHNEGLKIFLQLFSITIPLALLSRIYLSVIRAYENINLYSFIVNIFHTALQAGLLVLLVLVGLGTSSIIFSYILGFAGLLIVSYFGARYYVNKILKGGKIEKKERRKLGAEFFAYSWPIIFLGIIHMLFTWTDSFVIGFFNTASDVGFYNVAFSIAALFGIAPDLFVQLFFPLIVREYSNKNLKVIRELSKQVVKWVFILNIPLFIIMVLFPGVIINVLFGADYLAAIDALRILAVSGILASPFIAILSSLLFMKGKSKLVLINLVSLAVFNFILNIILVPIYGLTGAAVSTLISWLLLNIALLLEVRHYVSVVPLRRKIFRIILVSIIPTALLLAVRNYLPVNIITLILSGLFFVLVYVFLIFITGCLDRNDMLIYNVVKSKIFGKK